MYPFFSLACKCSCLWACPSASLPGLCAPAPGPEFLNKLPNKSDFIRRSIVVQTGIDCPLCNGTDVVPRAVHDHYAPLVGTKRAMPGTTTSKLRV